MSKLMAGLTFLALFAGVFTSLHVYTLYIESRAQVAQCYQASQGRVGHD